MVLVNPNLDTLEASARALEALLKDLVFVGGTIAGLLLDDPGASQARPTRDVDVVPQIAGAKGYLWASKVMGQAGFTPDTSEGAPACRWLKDGLLVDLMGTIPILPSAPLKACRMPHIQKADYMGPTGSPHRDVHQSHKEHVTIWSQDLYLAFQKRGPL